MKKLTWLLTVIFFTPFFSAQYMIVGSDSISLSEFLRDNSAGLQTNGIDNTIKATQNFMLMQEFAKEHKADTATYFRTALNQKILDLRDEKFYPNSIIDPLLKSYVTDLQNEIKVQIFAVQKQLNNLTNYKKVYNQVKNGEITMATAIKSYTQASGEAFFLKPGVINTERYDDIKYLSAGSYSKLYEDGSSYMFIKVLGTRPSLGYMVFGAISYPNDAKANTMKAQIYSSLQSGKSFTEVAKNFGFDEKERKTAGLVLGSPTLPEVVYSALKSKKAGEYSEPVLMDNKFYVFYIFDKRDYVLNSEARSFFQKELMASSYQDLVVQRLVEQEKTSGNYKELPIYNSLKSSFQTFKQSNNQSSPILTYGKHVMTFGDLKNNLPEDLTNSKDITAEEWNQILNMVSNGFVYQKYTEDFIDRPEIKNEINTLKQTLNSNYVFSYLKSEMDKKPSLLMDYYNKNKTNYRTDKVAVGRIAIIADQALVDVIKSEIGNPNHWTSLKSKYNGRLDNHDKILVDFKEGDMRSDADLFTKYIVPFKPGVSTAKIGERFVVVAIDSITSAGIMSFDEAKDEVRDAVRQDLLQNLIEQQRAKTKIVVQPAFISGLEKKFKK